jgi:L-iditol 2-dehydrogenase
LLAIRLHGPRDLRAETLSDPGRPGPGELLLRVKATGICGSDLHTYADFRIGETEVHHPLILGHEFSGIVEETGEDARDGTGVPLRVGARVAVDPATSCGRCEPCRRGDVHLCLSLRFCGLFPFDGSLCERMIVSARNCFPLPDSIDEAAGALLEPLGVAIHAVRLSKIRPGDSFSVHGTGPIGLLILQVAALSGGRPRFAVERLGWRRSRAAALGALPIDPSDGDPARQILEKTGGRGVDIAFEAGWGGELIEQAAETLRPGGRLVLVGIPPDDLLTLRHSRARRKGLTVIFCRRLLKTYPRAIDLVAGGAVDLVGLITHHRSLEETAEAFALNERYDDGVVKIVIDYHS